MPELPEVETTVNGIKPFISQQKILNVVIRQRQLRYLIPNNLAQKLRGQTVQHVARRGKYILLHCTSGTLIIHLGMSGYLRCLDANSDAGKHDHVDILFPNCCLRYTDPRRFGAILWTEGDALDHPRLKSLGVEPFSDELTADYLLQKGHARRCSIKQFIMDSKVIVGVGNIYANEALFAAAIHPLAIATELTRQQFQCLIASIRNILGAAIEQGGTTLKDFRSSDGKPGYFKQYLKIYGRAGEKCLQCGTLLSEIRQGQRTTVYCGHCQRR